jgi:hypothetical protein
MIEEVGAPNMMEVPHPEEPVMSSSSRGSSSSGSESDNAAQEEGSEAVDPRESSQSYVFGPSIIMVDCVWKMASLGYFAEGTAREPGEEVVLEPTEDEAIVFKDFFCSRDLHAPSTGPCLYSTQVLGAAPPTDPNAIAQLSKYFLAVLSFGGVPTSDSYAKLYELHYQPKKVESDEGVMFQQFGCLNFHMMHY